MGPIDSRMKEEKERANIEGRSDSRSAGQSFFVGANGRMGKAVRYCTGGVTYLCT